MCIVPCYSSKFADENDFDKISEDVLLFRGKYNCPVILMGDFNSRSGDLGNSPNTDIPPVNLRRSKDKKKVDTYGRNFVSMCNDLNLKILNGSFGRDRGWVISHATRKIEII